LQWVGFSFNINQYRSVEWNLQCSSSQNTSSFILGHVWRSGTLLLGDRELLGGFCST
jgi:hypothetical protein